jgi:phytoene dehydrogenase-like protein
MSTDPMPIDRRQFFSLAALGSLAACSATHAIPGKIVGADHVVGHLVRDGKVPVAGRVEHAPVVIVGGGISGLAAARQLERRGVRDFVLLELESELGGNAVSGRNLVTGYPWGAHYVPIPNVECSEVVELFRELGIIVGQDEAGRPLYREEFLCHDPSERLFIWGSWQEGLLPQTGVSMNEQSQIEKFTRHMTQLRNQVGNDGRWSFSLPVDRSSRDPECLKWDLITMAQWMDDHGYTAPPLRWYVNYCCRDDFGASIDRVSAWAGLHYFASRRGEAGNAPRSSVLTWPEGNGWLVRRMLESVKPRVRSRHAVWSIHEENNEAVVDAYNAESGKSVRFRAERVVVAAPRFMARRIVQGLLEEPIPTYGPWMVANLTLSGFPAGRGVSLAWDNVFYESPSLGYVVATHQHLHPYPRETVLTYYRPLDDSDLSKARTEALERSHAQWCSMILEDLERVHPEIRSLISRIDVKIWGHGMVVPTPGYLWGGGREKLSAQVGRIQFAHSDMSGLSLFEEAYTRGVLAANRVADELGFS